MLIILWWILCWLSWPWPVEIKAPCAWGAVKSTHKTRTNAGGSELQSTGDWNLRC